MVLVLRLPLQTPGPTVRQPGGLVEQHLPRPELHLVRPPAVVEDVEEPGCLDLLLDVDDG